jgi:hypothetical protein
VSNYPISIPNNDPPLNIKVGDSVTITFTAKQWFFCDDETEFYDPAKHKYITHGCFSPGDPPLRGVAQKSERFNYSFTDCPDQAGGAVGLSGVRTIVVSSTLLLDFASFEKALESDPPLKELFCKCWPCAESLLKALVEKLPIPTPVKDFLEHLFAIGDEAYKKLCK